MAMNQDLVQVLVEKEQALSELKAQLQPTLGDATTLPEQQQQGQGLGGPFVLSVGEPGSDQGFYAGLRSGPGLEEVDVAEAAMSRCSKEAALLEELTPVAPARVKSASRSGTPEAHTGQSQSSSRAHSSHSTFSRSSAYSSDSEWQEPGTAFGHLLQSTELLQSSLTDTGLQNLQRQQLEQQLLSTSLKLSRRQERLERQPWHSKSPVKRSKLRQQGAAGAWGPWGRGMLSSSMPELNSVSLEGLKEYKGEVQAAPARQAVCVDGASYELGLEGEQRQRFCADAGVRDQGHSLGEGPGGAPAAPQVVEVAYVDGAGGTSSSSRSSSSSASAIDTMHEMLHRLQTLIAEDVQDSSSLMAASAQLSGSSMQQHLQQVSEHEGEGGLKSGDWGIEQQLGGEGAGLGGGNGVATASKLQVASARKLAAAQGSLAMMRVLESLANELQDLGARQERESRYKRREKEANHHHGDARRNQIGVVSSGHTAGVEGAIGGDAGGAMAAAMTVGGDNTLEHEAQVMGHPCNGGGTSPSGCIARSLIQSFEDASAASRALEGTVAIAASVAGLGDGCAAAGAERVTESTSSRSSCSVTGIPLEQLMQQQQMELDGIRQLVAVAGEGAAADGEVEGLRRDLKVMRDDNMGLLKQLAHLVYCQQDLRSELALMQQQLKTQQAAQGLQQYVDEGRKQRQLGQVVGVEGLDPLLGLGGPEASEGTLDVWEQEFVKKGLERGSRNGHVGLGQDSVPGALMREVKLVCQVVGVGVDQRLSVCIVAHGCQGGEWDEEEDLPAGERFGNAKEQQQQQVRPAEQIADLASQGQAAGDFVRYEQQQLSRGQGHLPMHQCLYQDVAQDRHLQPISEQQHVLTGCFPEGKSVAEGMVDSSQWRQFQHWQQFQQLHQQVTVRQEQIDEQQAQVQLQLEQQITTYQQAQQQVELKLIAAQSQLKDKTLALQVAVEEYEKLQEEKCHLLERYQQLEGERVMAEERCSSFEQQLQSMQEQHSKQLAQLQQEGAVEKGALEEQLASLQQQQEGQRQQQQEKIEQQASEVNDLQSRLTKAEMKVTELQMQLEVSLEGPVR
jgi:hypothetical protein